MVEAMLYGMRAGCPWKDPPAELEKLKFNIPKIKPLVIKNKLGKLFKCLVHDSKAAPELIARLPFTDYMIADKGYDSLQTQWRTLC